MAHGEVSVKGCLKTRAFARAIVAAVLVCMLDWFGLRFSGGDDPAKAWTLDMRPDATEAQKARFAAYMAHSKG